MGWGEGGRTHAALGVQHGKEGRSGGGGRAGQGGTYGSVRVLQGREGGGRVRRHDATARAPQGRERGRRVGNGSRHGR